MNNIYIINNYLVNKQKFPSFNFFNYNSHNQIYSLKPRTFKLIMKNINKK